MPVYPRRICFGITELDRGGAEAALVQIVTRLDRELWSPHVICLAERGPLAEPLEDNGIAVTCLDAKPSRNPIRVRSLVRQFRAALRTEQSELLQTFLFHANIVGRLAAKSTKVKRVLSGIRVAEKRSTFPLRIDKWTQGKVDRHVCVSEAVAQFSRETAGLDPAKIVVIPNGVDADRFANSPPADLAQFGVKPNSRVLLAVGRIDEQKDPLRVLDAFNRLATNFNDIELLFVGSGPLETELQERARQSEFSSRVHVAGWHADIPGLMKAATLLVLASKWEGMPNVVLEAGAAGLPVVATNVEGVNEVIKNDDLGWLVGIEDTNSLITGISTALNDQLASDKSNFLQTIIQKEFTWDSVADRYSRLFDSLLR